jgi:hypothetical protein
MPGAEPGLPVRRTQTGDYEGYDEWLDQLEAMPLDEALDLARAREVEMRLAHTLDAEREQGGGRT